MVPYITVYLSFTKPSKAAGNASALPFLSGVAVFKPHNLNTCTFCIDLQADCHVTFLAKSRRDATRRAVINFYGRARLVMCPLLRASCQPAHKR